MEQDEIICGVSIDRKEVSQKPSPRMPQWQEVREEELRRLQLDGQLGRQEEHQRSIVFWKQGEESWF